MTFTTLQNASVLDVTTGVITPDSYIVVEDGKIREVDTGKGTAKQGRTIDLKGRTVLPGLIDAHVHVTTYSSSFATLAGSSPTYVGVRASQTMNRMLMRGFTSVRDVGGADFGLAMAVEEELFAGPRLFYGGKALSQTGGHGDMRGPGTEAYDAAYSQPGLGVIADGVAEVRRVARGEIRRGANHIKIMGGGGAASPTDRLDSDQYSEEEISAIVEEASMANIYTVVHAYSARSIERSVRLGIRSIEHCNFIDEPTAAFMKEKGAFMVPTLVAYHMSSKYGLEAGMTPVTVDKINVLLAAGVASIEVARRAGVPMAYGTDLVGDMLHPHQLKEFSIRREVVPALELIQSATIVGARLLNRENSLGRVAVGYLADLIAVNKNPLDDITVLERPQEQLSLVMKGGAIYLNAL